MRLRYMELRNYRKFRDARIEFPDGVVAIVGSNGSGKTTILEAVTWALFGNVSSVMRDNKEGVVSFGASPGEECAVVLEFDLGEDSYRLARSMKGKNLVMDASLEVNGKLLAKGDTDVTKAIVAKLGMDHQAFFVSVFTKQKDLNALANIGPADRKKLVLRMLRVDSLEKVITAIGADANNAKREADGVSASLRDADGNDRIESLKEEERAAADSLKKLIDGSSKLLADRQAAIEKSQMTRGQWEAEEERYRQDVSLERKQTGARAGLQAMHESLGKLEKEIADLRALRESLPGLESKDKEYQEARTAAERHTTLREQFLRRQRQEEELNAKKGELETLRAEDEQAVKEMSGLPDIETSLTTVDANLSETRELISSISAQARVAESEAARLRVELERSKRKAEEIVKLGEDSNCPTCQRRMGAQYTDLLRRYREEQKALEEGAALQDDIRKGQLEQRTRTEQRRDALEARRSKLLSQSRLKASLDERARKAQQSISLMKEKLDALQKGLDSLGPVAYDAAAHDAAKRKASDLEPSHLALNRAMTKMERLPLAMEEKDRMAIAVASEEEALRAASQERRALGFEMKTLLLKKKEHEEARQSEERLAQDVIRAEGEQRRLASEIESLRKQTAELERSRLKYVSLMKEQEILNRLSQVMKGFKENVISRIVPTLSDTSSDLLSQLTEGKYSGMRLDENYQMWLYDQGEEFRLERFSGGEVDLANLCLRLAISRMIMERSGNQMNFLVLDEIFGSQDQSRKRSILETLGQLQKQFRQILLITHIDDVKDNVSAVLRVQEKEDGSSTAVLEG
ncbi:MAG TPA: SMC family ATPase [Methanomassiliicoccales archaeon]|nr:SMC family ATPase [Methanomassiliicoccales archaeon]